MIKVCITGEMGSGKSFCSKIFEQLGIPLFYTDDVSRTIVNTNQELKRSLSIANVPYVVVVKNNEIVHIQNGHAAGGEMEFFEKLKSL